MSAMKTSTGGKRGTVEKPSPKKPTKKAKAAPAKKRR